MKSFNVIGKCSIEFPKETSNAVLEKIEGILKKEIGTYNVQIEPKKLHFEMSGYKKIDFEPLKKIQKQSLQLLKKELVSAKGFNVLCTVYVESTRNMYFFEGKNK